MATFHIRRRRVGDTGFADPAPHAQFWRAANAERFDEPGALEVARRLFVTAAAIAATWAAFGALLFWAVEILAQ